MKGITEAQPEHFRYSTFQYTITAIKGPHTLLIPNLDVILSTFVPAIQKNVNGLRLYRPNVT